MAKGPSRWSLTVSVLLLTGWFRRPPHSLFWFAQSKYSALCIQGTPQGCLLRQVCVSHWASFGIYRQHTPALGCAEQPLGTSLSSLQCISGYPHMWMQAEWFHKSQRIGYGMLLWLLFFSFLKLAYSSCLLQIRTLRGHTNEKNFVGLTVNSEYIACGSETNDVFVYHKVRSMPIIIWSYFFLKQMILAHLWLTVVLHSLVSIYPFKAGIWYAEWGLLLFTYEFCFCETVSSWAFHLHVCFMVPRLCVFVGWQAMSKPASWHRFGTENPEDSDDEGSHFISAVCWKSESPTMLAANSQGTIKVLVLAPWILATLRDLLAWQFATHYICSVPGGCFILACFSIEMPKGLAVCALCSRLWIIMSFVDLFSLFVLLSAMGV
jgi:hypothetical protein